MIAVLLVPWAGCDGRLAVALICLAVGATGATFCGFHCAFQVIKEFIKFILVCFIDLFFCTFAFIALFMF